MKNMFAYLSNQVKGILLIIAGSLLVLNYFGFIEILDYVIALAGVAMIIIGIVLANLHKKVYVQFEKDSSNKHKSDDDTPKHNEH